MASSTSSAIPAARCCRSMTNCSSRTMCSTFSCATSRARGMRPRAMRARPARPGVMLVTSGPGATNAVTPLQDALMDSIPLVCITGQVPTSLIGSDAFQECDTVGITRPCTKHNWLVQATSTNWRASSIEAFHRRDDRPARAGRRRHPEGRAVRQGHLHAAADRAAHELPAEDRRATSTRSRPRSS